MITVTLSVILYLSLGLLGFLAVYTQIRCESRKRIAFLAVLIVIYFYLLGYLLEISASTTDGGFVARKVQCLGAAFLGPVFFIFVADYCEVTVNRYIKAGMLFIALAIVALIWTSESHTLFYTSFELNTETDWHYLSVTGGPLIIIDYILATVCILVSIAILTYRYIVWDRSGRSKLLLLIIGTSIPISVNFISPLVMEPLGINFYTPVSVVIVCVLFGINIIKYDLFDILPKAAEMALHSIKEAFILIDSKGGFINANVSAEKIFPSLKTKIKYSPIKDIQGWPEELKSLDSGAAIKFEIRDDNHYNANVSEIYTKDNLLGYFILIQDITETVIMTKMLEEAAYSDPLTGIMNRRHFFSIAELQIERGKRIGTESFIVFFDLDHFKKVNDTYGHIIGDRVLKSVADRVGGAIRSYDLFGRYGGEEFILLISDISEEYILHFVERIQSMINSEPIETDDTQLMISASFGVASVNRADNLEDAVKMADEALYRAKSDGRDRIVMAPVGEM